MGCEELYSTEETFEEYSQIVRCLQCTDHTWEYRDYVWIF